MLQLDVIHHLPKFVFSGLRLGVIFLSVILFLLPVQRDNKLKKKVSKMLKSIKNETV